MKIKQIVKKNDEQALHYFKRPSRRIKTLIELVNCLGCEREGNRLATPNDIQVVIWKKYPDKLKDHDDYKVSRANHLFIEEAISNEVLKEISSTPKVLQDYVRFGIWCDGEPSDEFTSYMEGGVFGRYDQVWIALVQLSMISDYGKDRDEDRDKFIFPARGRHKSVLVRVDENGILRRFNPLFLQIIEAEEVEAARIRECPICDRIFWAGRITQKCCTPQCANTFRVHRHRYRSQEEKADYKLRRARREKKRTQETQGASASPKKKGRYS